MRYYVITFLVGLIVTTVIAVLVGIDVESKCDSFSLGVLSGFGVWMLEWALLALGFCVDGYCGNITTEEDEK